MGAAFADTHFEQAEFQTLLKQATRQFKSLAAAYRPADSSRALRCGLTWSSYGDIARSVQAQFAAVAAGSAQVRWKRSAVFRFPVILPADSGVF
jgi:hypothetical protein